MEEALRAMLLSVAPVHWGMAPQGAARPFIVLTRISGVRTYSNDGQDAVAQSRVQADVYADSYGATKAVARRLVSAVSGRRAGVIRAVFIDNERDLPAADAEGDALFRKSVDLMVHHTE